MIKSNLKILVIMPAYNEEGAIKETINQAYKLKKNLPNMDVLVVNDGSKDNTVKEAKKTEAIIVNLVNNLGIGGAVQTGYIYAQKNNYDIAIQIDGDGQHDPKYIIEMVKLLEENKADMIIGSRFLEKTKYEQTFLRMLGINILSFMIKLLTRKKIIDTTSGYRAVNKEVIKIFSNDYPYDYPEPETTMKLILRKKRVMEIPSEMKKREHGISSLSAPLKSISYMVKVNLAMLIAKIKKNK